MKKILVLLIIPLLLICGCEKKVETYEEISYNDFIKKIDNKDNFILFIGSETCSHCQDYKKTVNKVVKDYGVKIYYIDVNKFSEEQSNKFKTYINYPGTPTTVFIYDGDEKTTYNRINGNLSIDKVIERLKKEGYIKE